jgi:hypothetical protein
MGGVPVKSLWASAFAALVCSFGPRVAGAQPAPDDWIRSGVHPTREATLARGREVRSAVSVDVDGDGRPDDLLVVVAPNAQEPDSDYRRVGLVVAYHRADGWASAFVTEREEPWTEVSWGPRLASPEGPLVVVQHSSEPPDGPGTSWSYDLMRFRPTGLHVALHFNGLPNEELRFSEPAAGTILVVSSRRRYSVIQWDGVSIAAGPWRRGIWRPSTGAGLPSEPTGSHRSRRTHRGH